MSMPAALQPGCAASSRTAARRPARCAGRRGWTELAATAAAAGCSTWRPSQMRTAVPTPGGVWALCCCRVWCCWAQVHSLAQHPSPLLTHPALTRTRQPGGSVWRPGHLDSRQPGPRVTPRGRQRLARAALGPPCCVAVSRHNCTGTEQPIAALHLHCSDLHVQMPGQWRVERHSGDFDQSHGRLTSESQHSCTGQHHRGRGAPDAHSMQAIGAASSGSSYCTGACRAGGAAGRLAGGPLRRG